MLFDRALRSGRKNERFQNIVPGYEPIPVTRHFTELSRLFKLLQQEITTTATTSHTAE
jgi:hypothetical protein